MWERNPSVCAHGAALHRRPVWSSWSLTLASSQCQRTVLGPGVEALLVHTPPAPAPSSLSLHPASSPLLAPPEKTDRLSRRCALPALNMMLSYSAKSLGSRSEGAALGFTSWGRVSPKDSGRAGALNLLMDRVHPRTEEAGAQDQGHACRGGPSQPDIPRSLLSLVRPRDPFLSAY